MKDLIGGEFLMMRKRWEDICQCTSLGVSYTMRTAEDRADWSPCHVMPNRPENYRKNEEKRCEIPQQSQSVSGSVK